MHDSMPHFVKPIAEWCSAVIQLLGVFIIAAFVLYALAYGVVRLFRSSKADHLFHQVRNRVGRGVLLGLELLVAADIINTVVVELNFRTVGVLAIIVLIRTFLSFTLEVELTGNWPWQNES